MIPILASELVPVDEVESVRLLTKRLVVEQWNITCDENKWQLSIVGTINNIGLFAGLPFAGFFSDR